MTEVTPPGAGRGPAQPAGARFSRAVSPVCVLSYIVPLIVVVLIYLIAEVNLASVKTKERYNYIIIVYFAGHSY